MREERGGRESREGGGELLMSRSECGLVVHPPYIRVVLLSSLVNPKQSRLLIK